MIVKSYLDALIEREGGYVNHPSDKGGPTTWGITERVAREAGYKGRMQDLPKETAYDIYFDRYWIDPAFNTINDINAPVAEELLDTGVNCGVVRASRWLQENLNLLNVRQAHYPDIEADGRIGNQTRAALRAFLAKRGADGVTVMLRMLNSSQGEHYRNFATKDQRQEDFVFGWFLHRVR